MTKIEVVKQATKNEVYRFQIYTGRTDFAGNHLKSRVVGLAHLRNGENIYALKLWTFGSEKYFLIPDKVDSGRFLIMTRESNRNPDSKNKYFWNIVGNAAANANISAIKLNFDLIETELYMTLHPIPMRIPISKNLDVA